MNEWMGDFLKIITREKMESKNKVKNIFSIITFEWQKS